MNRTKIEWATRSWNPVVGCTEISEGCEKCYAKFFSWRVARIADARQDERRAVKYRDLVNHKGTRWTGQISWFPERLNDPITKSARNERIFVCSMGDLFHPNVENWQRDMVFSTILKCPKSTFMILTKRPRILRDYWKRISRGIDLSHVWIGVTAENQIRADERIPVLLSIPDVSVLFISFEPLLERVDIRPYLQGNGIDWIIVGAETGRGAREFRVEWGYELLAQARNAQVPFFFKNLRGRKVIPEGLRVREFPECPTMFT